MDPTTIKLKVRYRGRIFRRAARIYYGGIYPNPEEEDRELTYQIARTCELIKRDIAEFRAGAQAL